jgi:magnesium transporter
MLALLAMFMPLINASAGNTGNQVAGLMIRGFAVADINLSDWLRILLRELIRGMVMGVALGLLAAAIVIFFGRDPATALAVGLAMVAAVTLANLLGSMLPFFFQRVGVDPAVTSGPFIACLMDVSSILIFFSLATGILHIMG